MKNEKKLSGTSLLELSVVIAVIGIMTAVGIGSISSTKNFSKLKSAQSEVTATIKTAQNYALQGKSQSDTVCGYGFRFEDNKKYEIFYNKLTGGNTDCNEQNNGSGATYLQYDAAFSSPVPNELYELPSGVTLNSPAFASAELFFTIPHAGIYGNDGSSYNGDTWKFGIPGNEKSIIINSKGLITEN